MQPLKVKTADAAVGRWPGILSALGIAPEFLRDRHGPCPACAGVDRYRFDDRDGRGTWFCSHCGSGDGFGLLRAVYGWGFQQAAKEVDRVIGTVSAAPVAKERSEESKASALREVWQAGRKVMHGDPVWRYLRNRAGIETIPDDVRYHPALKHSDGGRHPAMLAVMRYPDGTAASIHRTYLTDDGRKANVSTVKKIMPGKPLQTSSVRLYRAETCLGIAEGIETALAASMRFSMPVWAATNAGLMEAWTPPAGVETVVIFGDNDANFVGQAAALALAKKLAMGGLMVRVEIPEKTGADWADDEYKLGGLESRLRGQMAGKTGAGADQAVPGAGDAAARERGGAEIEGCNG